MRMTGQWRLLLKVLPLITCIIALKAAVHLLHLEFIPLSSLFSSVVGATVFLIGFMIAGTLTDFKESERLPSDLAASLHSIADECHSVMNTGGKKAVRSCLDNLHSIATGVLSWMREKGSTEDILADIEKLNTSFIALEPYVQATFINRIKNEQNQIRRMVLRMQTIRETSFVSTGYAIAKLSTFFLVSSLILTKDQPFFESLFFVGFITLVLTYMIALRTDLDNPFEYGHESVGDEVSLKPLEQLLKRIRNPKK